MAVALWQHGLKPAVRCLQLTDKPCITMIEAIERTRRHGASRVASSHVSALYNQVLHSAPDRASTKRDVLQKKSG